MQAFRILVIDDSVDLALATGTLLSLDGHDVRTAFCGKDALSIAAHFRPELVLCDISMPGMDGYEVAAALRDGPCPTCRLVAITGFGPEGRHKAVAAGFDEYLTKPVDLPGIMQSMPAVQT